MKKSNGLPLLFLFLYRHGKPLKAVTISIGTGQDHFALVVGFVFALGKQL